MGGEIGIFRQHISKKGSLNCFGEKNAWLSWLNSPTHSLKCGWFLISPRILEAMRDFATHVGGHAWRNIVTNVIADSERYNLTSVTKLTVVKLSFAMSSLSVYSAESGGEKRNYSLFWTTTRTMTPMMELMFMIMKLIMVEQMTSRVEFRKI